MILDICGVAETDVKGFVRAYRTDDGEITLEFERENGDGLHIRVYSPGLGFVDDKLEQYSDGILIPLHKDLILKQERK